MSDAFMQVGREADKIELTFAGSKLLLEAQHARELAWRILEECDESN